jgi:ABC-2 type transport system permease protein
MDARKRSGKYIKFAIYLVVIVLLNLVGLTLFLRLDLTGDRIYSISKISKEVVSTLKEPLTVKVFFTKNLPAPHNNTERYLRDLLEEYALNANRFFSFEFYDVSPESEGANPAADANREIANNYGINPIQIQQLEKDEVNFKQAYMGLALIHGDMVERIPTITSTDGLEYKLTTAIMKVNNKISALLNLNEKIRIQLILSSSLMPVAPFMKVADLPKVPEKLQEIVKKLNTKNYGQLEFSRVDPSAEADQDALSRKYNIPVLQWPELGNGQVSAGKGVIGLVMTYKDREVAIPIFQVVRIPIIGTQYSLAPFENMEEMLNNNVESIININREIGYLSDHGALPMGLKMPMGPQHPETLTAFSELLNKTYSVNNISLTDEAIPENLKCIMIARPTQPFTDWELYQIDQALMRGQNLALFLEPFKEVQTQVPNPMGFAGQRLTYEPIDTGLEKLLTHYGAGIRKSIVLDEACFKQPMQAEMGGGQRPIYFAPIIKNENINKDFSFMEKIKGIITLKSAPLELDTKRLSENGIKATLMFSSSEKSWEMQAPINLNPLYIQKADPNTPLEKKPLACLLSGEFPSYFAGKPVPEKVTAADTARKDLSPTEKEAKKAKETPPDPETTKIVGKSARLEKGKPAKIFLVGTAELVRNDVIDPEGRDPNAMFVMNMIDLLNGSESIADMRSKTQSINPLTDTSASAKTGIKAFNIVGLPVLMVVFGLVVWGVRHSRKKSIQMMFNN